MSKRILGVVLVMVALVASNAYASRARDLVLGTGDGGVVLGQGGSSGTFYTDDAYNMFYNPAYVNDYKNWAIVEKSNFSSNGTAQGGTTAQGGFVTGISNYSLALFFNRQDDLQDAIYAGGTKSTMRPIELLFGSSFNDIKWGLGLSYASYTTPSPNFPGTTTSSSDWVVHAGFSFMNLDPFIDWRVSGTDNALATNPSNKGLTAGLRYHWGDFTPYAIYKYAQYGGVTDDRDFGIGIGRVVKAAEAVRVAYSIAYFRQSNPNNNGSLGAWNGTASPGDRSVIPLNISIEGDALSWLTLRAGLGYNIMDRVAGNTVTDNTQGRLGATAHAGKLDFDMAVGSGTNPAEAATQANGQTFDFSSGVFTAASLQYHW